MLKEQPEPRWNWLATCAVAAIASPVALVIGPERFMIAHGDWLVALACLGCLGLALLVRGLIPWGPFGLVVILACADQILRSNAGEIDSSILVFYPGVPMLAATALGVGVRRALTGFGRSSPRRA